MSDYDWPLPDTPAWPTEDVAGDLQWLRSQIVALCEDTEDRYAPTAERDTEGKEGAYSRGRIHEAKSIRNAICEVVRERQDARVISPPDEDWERRARDAEEAHLKVCEVLGIQAGPLAYLDAERLRNALHRAQAEIERLSNLHLGAERSGPRNRANCAGAAIEVSPTSESET